MTHTEIRKHIATRAFTTRGTIARAETEQHSGRKGETHIDVQPVALAFIRAAHGEGCHCEFCR